MARLFLFEQLGDEYFSWWYVQHMLPYLSIYGSGINVVDLINVGFTEVVPTLVLISLDAFI